MPQAPTQALLKSSFPQRHKCGTEGTSTNHIESAVAGLDALEEVQRKLIRNANKGSIDLSTPLPNVFETGYISVIKHSSATRPSAKSTHAAGKDRAPAAKTGSSLSLGSDIDELPSQSLAPQKQPAVIASVLSAAVAPAQIKTKPSGAQVSASNSQTHQALENAKFQESLHKKYEDKPAKLVFHVVSF